MIMKVRGEKKKAEKKSEWKRRIDQKREDSHNNK